MAAFPWIGNSVMFPLPIPRNTGDGVVEEFETNNAGEKQMGIDYPLNPLPKSDWTTS